MPSGKSSWSVPMIRTIATGHAGPTGHTGGVRSGRLINQAARVGVAILLALTTACTTTVAGSPVVGEQVITKSDQGGGVDSSFVRNTDGGPIDQLAATVV